MGKQYKRGVDVLSNSRNYGGVIFSTDFENGNPLLVEGTGDDFIGTVQNNVAFEGTQALMMQTRDVDKAQGDRVIARRNLFLDRAKIGVFDITFNMPDVSDIDRFYIDMDPKDIIETGRFSIRYDVGDLKWQYEDFDNAFIDINPTTLILEDNAWYKIRITVDFRNKIYKSFQMNHLFFDLENAPMPIVTASQQTSADWLVLIEALSTNRPIIYIDNMAILTQE